MEEEPLNKNVEVKEPQESAREMGEAPQPKKGNKVDKAAVERESTGAFLKQARQDKGITLEKVHEATKIPMDALKAIEEGYTIRILSPFYYRGFVKMYAQFLELDPGQLPGENKSRDKKESTHRLQRYQTESAFEFPVWLTKFITLKMIYIILGFSLALFLLFQGVTFLTHKTPAPSAKVSPQEEALKITPTVPLKVAIKNTKGSEDASSTNPAQDITVSVRTKKDSWLQVKVDGRIVFQSTLRRGAFETWNGHDAIIISGKNINQLEFEINGKLIGALSKSSRPAKEVVINKTGLTVTK